jgi:hypothetical protein
MSIREDLSDINPEALLADGFEDALIGICYRAGQPPIAAYSRRKCIELLVEQGLTGEDAEEHFEFNVVGAWVGEGTPVFIDTPEDDDDAPT